MTDLIYDGSSDRTKESKHAVLSSVVLIQPLPHLYMRNDDDHIHGDHANDDFSSEQTIEEEQAERT